MSGRGPSLDRASGSFRHSERYAATAARYSRALERERNVEEVTRDGGGATSKGGGERESLLETPDYLERQRARNDSFKRGCGRMLVFVLVLAVFGAVAAVGFDHFGRNTHGPTPPAPAPVTTDSRQSGRVVNDQPTARAAAAKYSPPPTEKSAETSPAEVRAPSPEKETTSSSEMTPVVEPTPAPKPTPTSEAKPTPAPKVEGAPAAKPAAKPAATASKGESTDKPAAKPAPKPAATASKSESTDKPAPKPASKPAATASKSESADRPVAKPAPKPAATATRDEPTLSEAARKASGTYQTHESEEPSPSKDEETSNVESDDEEDAAAAYRSLSETELADANENDDGAAEADDESARVSASEDAATFEALSLVDEAVRREKQGTGGLGSALLTGQKERLVHQFQAS